MSIAQSRKTSPHGEPKTTSIKYAQETDEAYIIFAYKLFHLHRSALARRDYGEGSVYQRKSDGRWVASIRLPDGKRKTTYYETEKQAKEARKQMQRVLEQGALVTEKDQAFTSFLEEWLAIKQPTIKPTTFFGYSRKLYQYVIPRIGHIKLQRLTVAIFQRLYSELQQQGIQPGQSSSSV